MNMAAQFTQSVPVGAIVHEVAKLFRRRFEDDAREFGITLPQWKALGEIARSEGVSQINLANAIDADAMTVSGILDRLEKRGLVDRYPDPNDSRAKLARVTPAGRELMEQARGVAIEIYEKALGGVSASEQKLLTGVLERIRNNLAAEPAAGKGQQT